MGASWTDESARSWLRSAHGPMVDLLRELEQEEERVIRWLVPARMLYLPIVRLRPSGDSLADALRSCCDTRVSIAAAYRFPSSDCPAPVFVGLLREHVVDLGGRGLAVDGYLACKPAPARIAALAASRGLAESGLPLAA